ncbi:MAG TPA: [Fe-Fe] hydrogenase large subunit C-terminal domain-containing protein [Elusimicrobiales bacterium]|nr:[Fe-Fe] hydrogenase large subunit C-terminal domain-containing protein [Elusimicrobiales bacterium]
MSENLVYTVKELCRTCYTCVRGCPAKAIRISQGQAEIIDDRCISCANCVLMCSRGAKKIKSNVDKLVDMFKSQKKLAVILAPSFPVEFVDMDVMRFVGMFRKAGFRYVCEVSFGADMVSIKYRELINKNPGKKYISSTCPSVVNYIEKYHPLLVNNIAPVVSPMVATARVVKKFYGEDVGVVFVGPCVAKKKEAESYPEIDMVLTFSEIRDFFSVNNITPQNSLDSYFDPPYPAKGVLYPVGRGLLNASEFDDDILSGRFMTAVGLENFTEALKNFEKGDIKADFLDLLCCDGCIMGPGITNRISKYRREEILRNYAREKYFNMRINEWESFVSRFNLLDYSTSFSVKPLSEKQPSKDEIKKVLENMGKFKPEDELNCGACGYPTCSEHAIAIIKGLAENEMCLPYTIDKLKVTAKELKDSYDQLSKTKQALMQSEKLAGMGQLAASIAHELNNPLGVVLLYSKLIEEEIDKKSELYSDIKTIVEQAERCKKIVASLLNFARKNKPVFKKTDIHSLFENYFKMFNSNNIEVVIEKSGNTSAEIDPDQITQVITNLVTNAVEAMSGGGRISVKVFEEGENVCFTISDTGCGIKEENMKKIFEPFFTTKQIGKGTGLGLAVSYGIIKAHKGAITVKSNADSTKGPTGTVFKVSIPKVSYYKEKSGLFEKLKQN